MGTSTRGGLNPSAKNPWLGIPLEDYEAHMADPAVGQARLLADLLGDAVESCRPRSVAVLGCAGGNGFDRLTGTSVDRVVGIDLNPSYVARARERYGAVLPGLELVVGDIATLEVAFDPVDLVFAGLVFEYVETDAALRRVRAMVRPGGTLVAVLQLPGGPDVTPSPYESLRALGALMHLVPPDRLAARAERFGLQRLDHRTVRSGGGKEFAVQVFEAGAA